MTLEQPSCRAGPCIRRNISPNTAVRCRFQDPKNQSDGVPVQSSRACFDLQCYAVSELAFSCVLCIRPVHCKRTALRCSISLQVLAHRSKTKANHTEIHFSDISFAASVQRPFPSES